MGEDMWNISPKQAAGPGTVSSMRSRRMWALSAVLFISACTSQPSGAPIGGTIPDGVIAPVASLAAQIPEYGLGASNATLTFGYLEYSDRSISWSPFGVPTSVAADGVFSVDLPTELPDIEGGYRLPMCGAQNEGHTLLGALVTHARSTDSVTADDISGTFMRIAFPDNHAEWHIYADGVTTVVTWHAASDRDLRCSEEGGWLGDGGDGDVTVDVDVRLRTGWNTVTLYSRSAAGGLMIYVRSGEPSVSVDWVQRDDM